MGLTYAQERSPQNTARRWAVLASVAVIHVGAFYGLIVGLAGVVRFIDPRPPLVAHNDPAFPITPPTAQPKPKPPVNKNRLVDRPPTEIVVKQDTGPTTVATPDLGPIEVGPIGPTVGTGDAGTVPTQPPTPHVTPRHAMPRGKPGGWITNDDYPAQDLREGNSGATTFRLTIGRDGHPQGCTIVVSSGHPRLDAATCDLVARRAVFNPATDDTGATIIGSFQSKVIWTIPDR